MVSDIVWAYEKTFTQTADDERWMSGQRTGWIQMRSSQQARKNAGILREETYLRLIQQRYDVLSDRERRVADILLLHTHDQNLEFSISSLAQAAGVSEATVTRFSRSLGFSGFREFLRFGLARSSRRRRIAPESAGTGQTNL